MYLGMCSIPSVPRISPLRPIPCVTSRTNSRRIIHQTVLVDANIICGDNSAVHNFEKRMRIKAQICISLPLSGLLRFLSPLASSVPGGLLASNARQLENGDQDRGRTTNKIKRIKIEREAGVCLPCCCCSCRAIKVCCPASWMKQGNKTKKGDY